LKHKAVSLLLFRIGNGIVEIFGGDGIDDAFIRGGDDERRGSLNDVGSHTQQHERDGTRSPWMRSL